MFHLQTHRIIRYLLAAIILFFLLRYIPANELSTGTILTIIVIHLVCLFIIDELIKKREGMMTNFSEGGEDRAHAYNFKNQNDYYPFKYTVPSGGAIPYSDVDELIRASKMWRIFNQHNFNILWSPHTHIGKARGYMNWEGTYD
jgi:hypothetical protein